MMKRCLYAISSVSRSSPCNKKNKCGCISYDCMTSPVFKYVEKPKNGGLCTFNPLLSRIKQFRYCTWSEADGTCHMKTKDPTTFDGDSIYTFNFHTMSASTDCHGILEADQKSQKKYCTTRSRITKQLLHWF